VCTPRRQRQSQAQATTTTAGVYDSQIRFPLSAFGRYFSIRSLKSAIRNYALLFVGTVLFHVAGTWTLPLIDRDEPRFAEASREMIERGDYVIPYFNNQFRFDKPPFTYWAQVASYKVFGEDDFAARLPSTIAAALTALSIFAWGSRMGRQKLGWWAAIIFTLSLQTFVHAKAAVADMWLVLFVTLAHWSGYELLRDQFFRKDKRPTSNLEDVEAPVLRRFADIWWWVFYIALAFAFLAKGPIGWIPLLTVISTMMWLREPGLARRFKFLRGIMLTLVIVSIWGIPALVRTHGEFFWIGIGRHVIGRSIATMEGHGANSFSVYLLLFPFYFVTVFASFFPWSIKLPRLCYQLWRKRDSIDNYLLGGAAAIFFIFTLVKTKLPHYTLPAFPLLALLLARMLIAQDSTRFLKRCAIAAAAVYLIIAFVGPPFIVPLFPAPELLRQSRDYLRPEMEFGSVDFAEPSLVWYFRGRVTGWMTTLSRAKVKPFMEKMGPRFVIIPTALVEKVFPSPPASWKRFSTRGFNIVKGRHVDLTLLLKPD
jgi:4-amino-4-deoxy-L-arabinose transferase-like glycosyltransferase